MHPLHHAVLQLPQFFHFYNTDAAVVLPVLELLHVPLFYQYKISNTLYKLHHNHTTNIFHRTAKSVPGTFFHKQLFPALSFQFFSAV